MYLLVASSTFKENMPFFFSFSEIRLLNSGVMPCVLKQRHADWILTVQSNTRHTRSVIDAGTSAVDVAHNNVVCWRASCIYQLSRAQSAEASTCFSSLITPATKRLTVLPFPSLLSMPSAIYFHELTFHPTLLWCDVSLLRHLRQAERQRKVGV